MDTDLLMQGVELMLLGMGIVFGFLTVLVFTLRGMSSMAGRLGGAEAVETAMQEPIIVLDHHQRIAVISAAVFRYRVSRAR